MTEQEETDLMSEAIKQQFSQDFQFFVDTVKSWPLDLRKKFAEEVLFTD